MNTTLEQDALALCYAIEEAGASDQLTKCSVMASDLRKRIAEREVTVRELLVWAKDRPACPGFAETIENIEQLTEEFLAEKGAY